MDEKEMEEILSELSLYGVVREGAMEALKLAKEKFDKSLIDTGFVNEELLIKANKEITQLKAEKKELEKQRDDAINGMPIFADNLLKLERKAMLEKLEKLVKKWLDKCELAYSYSEWERFKMYLEELKKERDK